MSKVEILAELPGLSADERAEIQANQLRNWLATNGWMAEIWAALCGPSRNWSDANFARSSTEDVSPPGGQLV